MNAAQRRMKSEKDGLVVKPPHPDQQQMISIARKIYKDLFTDEYTEGKFRMSGLKEVATVYCLAANPYITAQYKAVLKYVKLYERDRTSWLGWKRIVSDHPSLRYLPEISIVQRD